MARRANLTRFQKKKSLEEMIAEQTAKSDAKFEQLLQQDMMNKKMMQQQFGSEAVPVGGTDPYGVRYETPESVSKRKFAKEDIQTIGASDSFNRSKDYILEMVDKDPKKFKKAFIKANVKIPGLTFGKQSRGNILGFPTTFGDENAVNINRELTNMSDMLLRLRSGASINEDEYQRLRSLLPTYNDISIESGEGGVSFPTIRKSLYQLSNDLAMAKQRAIQGGYFDNPIPGAPGYQPQSQYSPQAQGASFAQPPQSQGQDFSEEREQALIAIQNGAPEIKVRERFRQRTGQDL